MLIQGIWRRGWLALLIGVGTGAVAAETPPLAEGGYLGDLPVVLSVTRLAQSLADTPGAVTVIDRDMIRRSGARTVTELLRYVPGFLVSGWNGANPIAQYHVGFAEDASRLQVFVDGRSVYSSLFVGGDAHRGLAAIVMEDIERVEVLRGSNSAAYGSNAFMGVINIITRNSADTRGTLVSVSTGSNGINDQVLRYGWGNNDASFRVTAAHRADNGYDMREFYPSFYGSPSDNSALSQFDFRGDMRLSPQDDLLVTFGASNYRTDEGDGTKGNAPYSTSDQAAHVMVRWNRQVSDTDAFYLSASFDDDDLNSPVYISGHSQRSNIEFSYQQQPSESVRTVWGTSWRRESAESPLLFNNPGQPSKYAQTQIRLFGNAEWRLSPHWLLNAGGLFENESGDVGSSFAPRVMMNWQPLPEHTFRIGATKATRSPSLFELYGSDLVLKPSGAVDSWDNMGRGLAKPERVYSREIGWLGDFRAMRLTVDLRVFQESLRDLLRRTSLPSSAQPVSGMTVKEYRNEYSADTRGWEYQVQWRPYEGSRLWWAQSRTRVISEQSTSLEKATPGNIYTAAWFQDLPSNWELGVTYSYVGSLSWRSQPSDRIPSYGTTSLRLAKHFRIGSAKSELALTVQSLDGDHLEFLSPTSANRNPVVPVVQRRTFLTFRTEI